MGHESSFEKALYFTKCSVYLAGSWPPPRAATKWEIIKSDIVLFIICTNIVCVCIPIAFSIYVNRHDMLSITESIAMLGGFLNVFIKTIVFRTHRNRMQILIEELENFLKKLRSHERIILQRYFDRCSLFHTVITVMNYIACSSMFLQPLVLHDQTLPMISIYPFNVDSGILMYLVYIHQSIALVQSSAGVTIDCQAALIMWFAGSRFEMLTEEILNVSDINEFENFVRKHKKVMSYAIEISDTMRYVAFVSSVSCGISAIMCALQLLSDQPVTIKITFALGLVICTVNLFISAWPADNLIYVCKLLANTVYSTSWFDMSPNMTKNLLIVLQRCQRPIIVSVSGFLPTLSLRSYATFLSGLFSYFTTLRVVMLSEN